ncbi:MAG: hypothetical protein ACE5O2_12390 [Armatimonadota bacterium]
MRFRHFAIGAGVTTLATLSLLSCRESDSGMPTSEAVVSTGEHSDALPVAPGEMESPVRIAVGKKGRLFVSDFFLRVVFELEAGADGARVERALAIPGRPLGVAWAGGNRLIVGNASTQSVDVYRAKNGKWLYSLGGPGAVKDPTDIAVDRRRRLAFVLDGYAQTVRVFALRDGSPLHTISAPGPGDHYLQHPTGIAVDPARREVLVSDYGEPTYADSPPAVKIFRYNGTHVKTISGQAGMLGQRFSRPQGLAVDGAGRILVVDALAGEVLVLDRETGDVLQTLGSLGSGPGELWLPLDVVVNRELQVFVTNNRPRRVEVFQLGG